MKSCVNCIGRVARLTAALAAAAALSAPASTMLGTTAGCSAPNTTGRIDPIGPDRAQFDLVAPMLARRCGSLDCHGSNYRNMRIYGYGGARLRDAASPSTAGLTPEAPARLTTDEIEATYQAVIGLEPEIMRAVVKAGGAGAEDLTLVRKARGDEEHKGKQRIKHGDDADSCLLTWLKGSVNVAACTAAGCIGDGGLIESEGCVQPKGP